MLGDNTTRRLFVLIEGGDVDVFEVSVAANKHISHLKDLIYEKGVSSAEPVFVAGQLMLLKVDINLSDYDTYSVRKLVVNESEEGVQLLTPWLPVSNYWPTQPADTNLHIVVKLPAAGADSRKRKATEAVDEPNYFELAKTARLVSLAPSDISKPSFYEAMQESTSERILDDRPSADLNVAPTPLLYSGFGHFGDVYNGCDDVPYLSCIDLSALELAVDDFANYICELYEKEDHRRSVGPFLLNAIFACRKGNAPTFSPLRTESFRDFRTDAHNRAAHQSATIVLLREGITEITSILEVEAAAYFAQFNIASEYRSKFFGRWRAPCLAITVAGHLVTFYAIILLGHRYRIVSLTPGLSCFYSAEDFTGRSKLYRAFAAASVLDMQILADVRRTLANLPPRIPSTCWLFPAVSRLRKYPMPEAMDADDPQRSYLEFQIQEDMIPSRLLFLASTTGNKHVVIKFTRRYCAELHALCAKLDRAPQLLAFERLPGGWFGVAMEYITVSTPLKFIPKDHAKRPRWQKELHELMTEFHGKGLVHGDLRDVNIIVEDDERVLLVDFDWGGEDGKTAYPRWNLSTELLDGRAHEDLEIRKEDDERILAHTFSKSS